MAPYLLFFALGLVALVQVSLIPALGISPVPPDPMLVIVVAWGVLRGVRSALIWALIGGLWLDLLSSAPFGGYTLGLLAAAGIAGFGSGTIYRSHWLLALAMVALATVAQDLVQVALLWLAQRPVSLPDTLTRLVLPEILANMVLMLIVFPVLGWVNRVTGRERIPVE
ncbi:MAG: rod shape-determining protein MreD [Caldilineales bacterium]